MDCPKELHEKLDVAETSQLDWKYLKDGIMDWWEEEGREFPWRSGQPEWKLLVTEVMLQRTRAEAVRDIYESFFDRFSTPEELAAASVDDVGEAIESLGLAWRAKFISRLGEELAENGGHVPSTDEELRELSGVGDYVAGAFRILHQNKHSSFIDVNVVRLLARYFGFEWHGETRRRKWFRELADRLFEHDYEPRDFGYAVLDFGREVCSRKPRCEICPVQERCCYSLMQSRSSLSDAL
jgi:A/G-specific adenine glycosylase